MGGSAVKYNKRVYSILGDVSIPDRVIILENNEYKITYFAEISSSTGSITIPTGATILLDQLQGGVDAYVCTIQNGQPTGNFPQTGGGVTVDVTSFNALGAYALSGTPSSYPVALIYILKIKAKDYSNLDITKILDLEDINAVSKAGDTMYGDLTITTLTASQIVETDANKKLISAAKGTAYNKNFGTTSGTVLEGDRISQTITNGVTDKAPSEDAVFDALIGATIPIGFLTAINPADSTVYRFGGLNIYSPTSSSTALRRFRAFRNGKINAISFNISTNVVPSNEANTLEIRNVTTNTTVLISNTWEFTGQANILFTGFEINVSGNDQLEIIWTTPNYATNPTSVTIGGYVYLVN